MVRIAHRYKRDLPNRRKNTVEALHELEQFLADLERSAPLNRVHRREILPCLWCGQKLERRRKSLHGTCKKEYKANLSSPRSQVITELLPIWEEWDPTQADIDAILMLEKYV